MIADQVAAAERQPGELAGLIPAGLPGSISPWRHRHGPDRRPPPSLLPGLAAPLSRRPGRHRVCPPIGCQRSPGLPRQRSSRSSSRSAVGTASCRTSCTSSRRPGIWRSATSTSRRSLRCSPVSRSCPASARRRSGSSRRWPAGRSWSRRPSSRRCSAPAVRPGAGRPHHGMHPGPARRRPRGQHHSAGPAGLDRGAAVRHHGTAAGQAAVVARRRCRCRARAGEQQPRCSCC